MTDLVCSFCGKPAEEAETLVAGPGVYICDECIDLCDELVATKSNGTRPQLPMWESMDNPTLLAHLPRIARSAEQATKDLRSWVDEARRREQSWEKIGGALGMTRQSAWEKFA